MAEDTKDRRPGAEPPPPRNDWIRERLAKLARKDALLKQIGYTKPQRGSDAHDG